MIIRSLKLGNIRSYVEEEINFQEGSTMMSGDIGTGKTTILLAIEFALFGIIRGQLSGTSLLRHGSKEGYVELTFSLDDKKIIVRRELKRNVRGVNQDAGFIIVDDIKQDLTPVELKSKILELIGYPDELLTKSKSLIYRYTVYTAQEEMKQILYERPDERLDVLRKIFDIDKYKRIKENVLIYQKALRMKAATLEGKTEDLELKKEELKQELEKTSLLEKKEKELCENILIVKKELEEKERIVKEHEEKAKQLVELKNKIMLKKNDISSKKLNEERIIRDTLSLQEKQKLLTEELSQVKVEGFEDAKKRKLEIIERENVLLNKFNEITTKRAKANEKKSSSEYVISKIVSLDNCPTCEQEVKPEYKEGVKIREKERQEKINNILEQLNVLEQTKKEEQKILFEEKQKLDELLRSEQAIILKRKQLEEYSLNLKKLSEEKEQIFLQQKNLSEELLLLEKNLSEQPDVTTLQTKANNDLVKVRQKVQLEEITVAETKRERETIGQSVKRISEEIELKKLAKEELIRTKQTWEWMIKYMINIVSLMEKQILLKIYGEFNETFQEWFNTLIEDENLNVRLDENFTPIIEQNGYETFIENLSGGEKTSVALAYRLALNKVINDFISTIKTRDLLILDEPTDGFSSEQLDKLREVLDKLDIKQILMVSHEPKLESYVDHIVRVFKEEHQSRVIS